MGLLLDPRSLLKKCCAGENVKNAARPRRQIADLSARDVEIGQRSDCRFPLFAAQMTFLNGLLERGHGLHEAVPRATGQSDHLSDTTFPTPPGRWPCRSAVHDIQCTTSGNPLGVLSTFPPVSLRWVNKGHGAELWISPAFGTLEAGGFKLD